MDNVAKVEPVFLSALAQGSPLLKLGKVDAGTNPVYDKSTDAVVCHRLCSYGEAGWSLPPKNEAMGDGEDDRFLWFARYLLEGTVHDGLKTLAAEGILGTEPREITLRKPKRNIMQLVARLRDEKVDCMAELAKKLRADDRWLWAEVKAFSVKDPEKRNQFKKVSSREKRSGELRRRVYVTSLLPTTPPFLMS